MVYQVRMKRSFATCDGPDWFSPRGLRPGRSRESYRDPLIVHSCLSLPDRHTTPKAALSIPVTIVGSRHGCPAAQRTPKLLLSAGFHQEDILHQD